MKEPELEREYYLARESSESLEKYIQHLKEQEGKFAEFASRSQWKYSPIEGLWWKKSEELFASHGIAEFKTTQELIKIWKDERK